MSPTDAPITNPQAAPSPAPLPETSTKTHMLQLAGMVGITALIILGMVGYQAMSSKPAETKQPMKIGIASFIQAESSIAGLKRKMAELGHTDVVYVQQEIHAGPNMITDMQAAFTKMLLEDKVDVIWADHEQQAKVAVDLTASLQNNTPIVFLSRFHDPVAYGIIKSFSSSGNNATGVTQNLEETADRNIAFAKELNPDLKKIAVFGTGFLVPGVGDEYFTKLQERAALQGIETVEYTTTAPPPQAKDEFERVGATIKNGDIGAIFHLPGHFYEDQQALEYALAKRLGIPHSVPVDDLPGGGHFAYSGDFENVGEQSAIVVDKIFKGTKPSDIPTAFGEKSVLVLHLTRAKETGLTFSDSMLYIAHKKIE